MVCILIMAGDLVTKSCVIDLGDGEVDQHFWAEANQIGGDEMDESSYQYLSPASNSDIDCSKLPEVDRYLSTRNFSMMTLTMALALTTTWMGRMVLYQ